MIPEMALTAASQNPRKFASLPRKYAPLGSISWIETFCSRYRVFTSQPLSDLLPYHRWCNHIMANNSVPAITILPKAKPGSSSVRVIGKALYIDQSLQVMRVFENGEEVRTIPVSTGLRMSYTPEFSGYIGHYVEYISSFGSLSDHAWYFTKATGNIYIHSAPYKIARGQKHYLGLEWLGVKPSSHGCVRIHPLDASWLLDWDPRGVLLTITPPDFVKFPD